MSMKSPKTAVCCSESCSNNSSGLKVLVCANCGRCGHSSCTSHPSCKSGGKMKDAVVAHCCESSCINNKNQREVMVCAACGQCGNCTFHGSC